MPTFLTPWTLPSHQALGGFDPLLGQWMRMQAHMQFLRPPWAHEKARQASSRKTGDLTGYGPAFAMPEVAAAFALDDLAYAARFGTDFELLHTVPLTLASKPFLFICHSMSQLFQPFTAPGRRPKPGSLDRLMDIYCELFASDACLAVLFPQKADLEAFARLFPAAAGKLHLMPLLTVPSAPPPRLVDRPPTLIFTTWPAPDSSGVVRAGGVLAIEALDRLRRTAPDARLILASRGGRAAFTDPDLRGEEGAILTQPTVRALIERNLDRIVWIDDHLSEAAMRRLFQSSDLFLAAGLEANPAAVLMAMTQGCIPVAARAPGGAGLIRNGHTGILLDLLNSATVGPNAYGFVDTDAAAFYADHDGLMARAGEALSPVLALAADPAAIVVFQAGMLDKAERQFQSQQAIRQMVTILGQAPGAVGGELYTYEPVDFAHDFRRADGVPLMSLAGRRMIPVGGGYVTAPEPGVRGAVRPFNNIPRAMADLLGLDMRPLAELLAEALSLEPRPSLTPDGMVTPLALHKSAWVRDASVHLLTVPETYYPEGGHLRASATGLAVLPNPQPWIYGLYIPLTEALIEQANWVILEIGPTTTTFAVGLLNAAGDAFVSRVEVPGEKEGAEIWLPVESASDIAALVLQNWDPPLEDAVVLHRLLLVRIDPEDVSNGPPAEIDMEESEIAPELGG